MFPNSKYTPTSRPEFSAYFPVPPRVGRNLFRPKPAVYFGNPSVPLTTMPETPIYEHGQAKSWEDEVGPSDEGEAAPPSANSIGTEQRRQNHFSRGVPRSLDPRHKQGPLAFGQGVHCDIPSMRTPRMGSSAHHIPDYLSGIAHHRQITGDLSAQFLNTFVRCGD